MADPMTEEIGDMCARPCALTPAGRRGALVTTLAVVLLIALATAAHGHVNLEADEDPDPGLIVMLRFAFDHGCDGHATTGFVVQLPEGIEDVHVEPYADGGWEATVDDGVVTWSGGDPIPDHQLHAFRMEMVLPERPGETIHFPTIQRCGDDEIAWIQIPGEDEERGDLDRPAPELTLTDRQPPDRPGEHALDDETPPPAPDDVEDEPTMEPEVTPVEDAADEGTNPLAVAGLALLAAIAAAAGVLGWRRGRGPSSGDPGAGP